MEPFFSDRPGLQLDLKKNSIERVFHEFYETFCNSYFIEHLSAAILTFTYDDFNKTFSFETKERIDA